MSERKNGKDAQSELEAVRKFVAEQKKLQRAAAAAEKAVRQAEQELDEARRALARARAERLIKDPDCDLDGDECPESVEFVSASLRLEEARAALIGVRRRIAERDPRLLSVSERLRAEREEYNRETIGRFLRETYQPAAEAFAKILHQARALEAALGAEIPEAHQLPETGDWKADEEARRLYDQHCELRQLSEALEKFRKDAERRVWLEERSRKRRAGFDPHGRYRVLKPFRCYGEEFEVGQLVDRYRVPVDVLSGLYESKRLELVQWEEEYSNPQEVKHGS